MQSKLNFHPDHQNHNSVCCSRAAWLLTGDEEAHRAAALWGHQGLGLQKDPVSRHIYPRGRTVGLQALQETESTQGIMSPHSDCALRIKKMWRFTIPSTGNTKVTLCLQFLNPVSPQARTGKQPWCQPGFPLPICIPPSFRSLALVYSNLSDVRLTKSTSNGTTRNGIAPCHCALGTDKAGWVHTLTARLFCVEFDWGFTSLMGCRSSISIIFLLISYSLKYNQVYSYSRHTNSVKFVWTQNETCKGTSTGFKQQFSCIISMEYLPQTHSPLMPTDFRPLLLE